MTETEYLEHTTVEGERWDQLADRYYGDPYAYTGIIAANPGVPLAGALAGGLSLRIPLRDEPAPDTSMLPPWLKP